MKNYPALSTKMRTVRNRFQPRLVPLEDRIMPGDQLGALFFAIFGLSAERIGAASGGLLADQTSRLAANSLIRAFDDSVPSVFTVERQAANNAWEAREAVQQTTPKNLGNESVNAAHRFGGIEALGEESGLALGDITNDLAALLSPFANQPLRQRGGSAISADDGGEHTPRRLSTDVGPGGLESSSTFISQVSSHVPMEEATGYGSPAGRISAPLDATSLLSLGNNGGEPHGPGGGPSFQWLSESTSVPTITTPANQTTPEGQAVNLQIAATGDPGDVLAFSATALPAGLSISTSGLITGTVDFAAAEGFGGVYNPTVLVTNGRGGSSSTSFTWTVTDVPRSPIVTNPSAQTNAQGDTVSLQIAASQPDSNPLLYSANGLPPGLTISATSGLITGTISLSAALSSPYAVTVTTFDGTLSASQSFSWTVTTTNHPPQVTAPGNQTNAAGDTVSLPIVATDADQEILTYTATGLPPGLSLDPGSGLISGTIANSAYTTSPYNVTVLVSDGSLSASQNFTWTVNRVGVTNPGSQSNVNGDTVSLQLQGSDAAGGALTFSATTALPPGLMLSSSGLVSGTLTTTADASSPYTVTVRATTADGTASASQTFTWTVVRVALVNPGNQTSVEGAAVSLQLSVVDRNGGTAPPFVATGLPRGLTVNATTGLISGTVDAAASGTSPYQVTLTYGQSIQTFVWVVTPHVVVINPGSQNNGALDAVSLPITARDVSSLPLSYAATGLPTGLSINTSTGLISGTIDRAADTNSPYTVTATVSAGQPVQFSKSQTFTWLVSHVFVANPGGQSSTTGDVVNLAIVARDNDGEPVSFVATGLPTGLFINGGSGVISGTIGTSADTGSPYAVTVTASDSASNSTSQTFSWTVTQHILLTNPGGQANLPSDSVSLPIVAVDPDGDPLSYQATGLPSGLGINATTGVISGTIAPTAESQSPYTVTVTASEGTHTTSQTFTWIVSRLLVANPGTLQSADGAAINVPILTRFTSELTPTFTATTPLPPSLTLNSSTGVVSGTLANNAHTQSPYLVTVQVTAGSYNRSVTFSWMVSQVGLTNPGARTNLEGDNVSLPILATDPNSPTLTYSASGLPAGLAINSTTGVIAGTITPGAAVRSPYRVSVAAADSTLSMSQTFIWTVTPYVVLTALPSQSNVEGDTVALQIQATDTGGRPLTYSADNLPPGLTLNAGTGLISGQIAAGASFTGPYTVTITASDGTYSSSQVMGWTVTHGNNHPPVLNNPGNQANVEADIVTLPIVASDPDGDRLTYSGTGLPDGLNIDPYSGVITGRLANSAVTHGPYSVTVNVNDGNGGSTSQNFVWMVNDAALTGQSQPVNAVEGTPANGLVLATFTDANPTSQPGDFTATINWGDGSSLDAGIVTAAGGSFSVIGSHTYAHPRTFIISVTIKDVGGSVTQTTGTATVAVASLSAQSIAVTTALCPPSICIPNLLPGGVQVAFFTDANPTEAASTYTATIDWTLPGSGTTRTTGTVVGRRGAFIVYSVVPGYTQTGSYPFTVTISDSDGTQATTTGQIVVGHTFAGPWSDLTVSGFTGVSCNPVSNCTATIVWGDLTSDAGTVALDSFNNPYVTGRHIYRVDGSYTVSVTLRNATTSQTLPGSVLVSRGPLTGFGTMLSSPFGRPFQRVVTGMFGDLNPYAQGYTATDLWGNGSTTTGTIQGGAGNHLVVDDNGYPAPGDYPLCTLIDWHVIFGPVKVMALCGPVDETINASIVGPTVVPSLSEYEFRVSIPPTPRGQVVIGKWDTNNHAIATAILNNYYIDTNGNVVGLYGRIRFEKKKGTVNVTLQGATVNGKLLNVQPFEVHVVLVKAPGLQIYANPNTSPRAQIGAADDRFVVVGKKNAPWEHYRGDDHDWFDQESRKNQFESEPSATLDSLIPRQNPAFAIGTTITLDPYQQDDIKKIQVGLIQRVVVKGQFDYGPNLVRTMKNETAKYGVDWYYKGGNRRGGNKWPWFDGSMFTSYNYNENKLAHDFDFGDSPQLACPLRYRDATPPTPLRSLSVNFEFTIDAVALTLETQGGNDWWGRSDHYREQDHAWYRDYVQGEFKWGLKWLWARADVTANGGPVSYQKKVPFAWTAPPSPEIVHVNAVPGDLYGQWAYTTIER